MADPGWYHVDGDPLGTVRRWNGLEWIGFPVPQAGTLGPTSASSEPVAVQHGMAGLRTLALITQLALLLLMIAALIITWALFELS